MELAARLRERRAEIEQAALARVHAVSDPTEVKDPEYVIGLRDAVSAALDYAIAGIETVGREPAPVPEQLLAQARAAARNGISLDTVLRRYLAGYSLLDDFLIRATEERQVRSEELMRSLRALSVVLDRLVAAISEEYAREGERRPPTAARRRAEQVTKLLAGEPVDPAELRYELGIWHLGLIASGPGAAEAISDLAATLDCSLLLVHPIGEVTWAWLGGGERPRSGEAADLAQRILPAQVSLALGEPGRGIEGWRLTHRQAKAAMLVARRDSLRCVRYSDVALLAAALGDDVLATSLRAIYLVPLASERDGGALLRATLNAYFETGRHASSAAASLGVSRQTVSIRLRAVEEKIGKPLKQCAADLETAIRLNHLLDKAGSGN